MISSELRIGNYIKGKGIGISPILLIEGIKGDLIYSLDEWILLNYFEPIPLTEEWLLKFGFKKDLGNDLYLDSTSTSFFIWQNNRVELLDDKNNICISHCEYVHQLQNLYFALTGQELKIKLKL